MGKSFQKWERSAIRSGTKTSGVRARSILVLDCDFLLFNVSVMAMDRLAALRVFSFLLSFCLFRAHFLSKAQRQQDPAQNSYEMNPTQQPTNYAGNQGLNFGGSTSNGASDDFYDEVFRSTSSPLAFPRRVAPLTTSTSV